VNNDICEKCHFCKNAFKMELMFRRPCSNGSSTNNIEKFNFIKPKNFLAQLILKN